MTRRLIREGDPPAGHLASPVPQYWNPNTETFEDVLGAHGAPRAILYGPNGQPISDSNRLPVADDTVVQALAQLATEGKLEEVRALLATIAGTDFATQATLAQVKDELTAVKAELEAVKANQVSGDQKVTVNGSLPIIWGATLDDRPAASSVDVGQIFALANAAMDMWISNGISWEAVE